MRLVNCSAYGGRRPPGSIYIGRATPFLPRSPLANPFIAASRVTGECMHAVKVPDESVLERFRRQLTCDIVKHFAVLDALRELGRDVTLACWCVDREAVLVGAGRAQPKTPCHGDVIFTVWTALDMLDWDVPAVCFGTDFAGANRAWAELYRRAFGERMLWGTDYEAGTCSLPPAKPVRGAA